MPKVSRFLAALLLIGLMVSLTGSVFAQDTYCLNLSEEDCNLYLELSESVDFPDSAAFEMNINGHIEGADIPTPVDFNVLATGAYVVDGEQAQAAIDEFSALSVLDVSLGSIIDVTDGVFSAFDAELNVQLTLPPDMGGSAFGPFDFWLVDGAGYIDFTPFVMFTGDSSMTGVMGVDLFDFIEVPLGGVTMGDLFAQLDGMGGGDDFDPQDFNFDDFANGENPFANAFEQMMNPLTEEDIAAFVKLQRLPDETFNGANVVVFQTTVSLARIFEVEALREQMVAQMEMQGTPLPEDMDINEVFDAVAEALGTSTITVVERYEAETGFGVAASIVMDMTLDPAALAVIDESAANETPVDFDLTIDFTRTNINNVQSINLPEDAQLIPVETLLGESF